MTGKNCRPNGCEGGGSAWDNVDIVKWIMAPPRGLIAGLAPPLRDNGAVGLLSDSWSAYKEA
jgi:hypothetical protein